MKGRGTSLKKYLAGEMRNPEFRRLYADAGIVFKVAYEIAKARQVAGISQGELARRIKTKQQTISRIELGSQNLTIVTLDRIARALHASLQVRIISS